MTRPDQDAPILKALRQGLTTSTEIATAVPPMTVAQVQIALNRLMDRNLVTRSKDSSGYRWAVAT